MEHTPKNRAYGKFGLSPRVRLTAADFALSLLAGFAVLLAGAQGVTQWLAYRLAYQSALGTPLLRLSTTPVYAPWLAVQWKERISAGASGIRLAVSTDSALQLCAICALVAAAAVFVRRYRQRANRASELHGSARWAERDDILRSGLLSDSGAVLGQWQDKKAGRLRWLRSDGPEHVLLFAPTGAGKGVGPVLSTLLTWRESLLVLDPKGENFELTSGWRSGFSRVLRLDFTDDAQHATAFNPLSEVRLRTPHEVADVQRMALQLLSPGGDDSVGSSEAGRYFVNAGSALLAGAIMHVLYRETARGRTPSLTDVAYELSDPIRPHGQVLQEWLEFAHDPELAQGWIDSSGMRTATHPFVATAARTQRNRDPKERSPILSTVVAALEVFRDPRVAANIARSDFAIADLTRGDQPISLYLVLRLADQDRLKPLVRLLLDLWIRRLTERTVAGQTALATEPKHRRILFLLDELPILGKLTIIETALAAARGWGLKFFLIAQDIEQIQAAYGKHETITSNCAHRAAFAPNKPDTARFLSSLVGTTTVFQQTHSESASVGSFFSRRGSSSEQAVKRELLTPDEIMRLPAAKKTSGTHPRIVEAGDMLVFVTGFPAIYAKQPLYFQDPILDARAKLPPAPPRPVDILVLPPPPLPPVSPPGRALTPATSVDDELLALADETHSAPGGDVEETELNDDASDEDAFAEADFEGESAYD